MSSSEDSLFGPETAGQSATLKSAAVSREAPSHKSSSGAKSRETRHLLPLAATTESRLTGFVDYVEPRHRPEDIILSRENRRALDNLVQEFRHADQLRRHSLVPRSRLLFCGPPGCGKTLAAEIFAQQVGLPLFVARLDAIVSSFLGETATNLRRLFEEVSKRPAVLFLDEFDAFAHARNDSNEHSEMRRVVNVLLMLVESYRSRGFLIAATNLQDRIDGALWRRFDEILLFSMPDRLAVCEMLLMKTKNFPANFDMVRKSAKLKGMSFADIDRVCLEAVKRSIMSGDRRISEAAFDDAIREERRRQKARTRIVRRRR